MPSKISVKIIIFFLLCVLIVPIPVLADKICGVEDKYSLEYCNCPHTVTPQNFKKLKSTATYDKLFIRMNKKYFLWNDDVLCPFTDKIEDELRDKMIRTGELKVEPTFKTYYYHTDHLGGTSVVTDEQGEMVEVLDYYPYGDTRISEQTRDYGTQKKFTGQEEDPESSLYYYGSRYYDPSIGRFTGQDPVFQAMGDEARIKEITGKSQQELLADPQSLNAYSYSRNNPLRYIDDTGEWFKEFFTGQQSWPSFQGEIGEATLHMGPVWQKIMDHPVAAGAVVGVAGGAVAYGVVAGITYGLTELGLIAGNVGQGDVTKYANEINKQTKNAYEVAKAGGTHVGTIKNYINRPLNELQSAYQSYIKQVGIHLNKIADPAKYEKNWSRLNELAQKRAISSWFKDATRNQKLANVIKGIINELSNK